MGLDLSLYKLDKIHYDKVKDPKTRKADFNDCHNHPSEVEVAYWRKRHGILELLGGYCDLVHDQTTYGELTRRDLRKALRVAVRQKPFNGEKLCPREREVVIPDLRRVLHQTNFKTETIALEWVS